MTTHVPVTTRGAVRRGVTVLLSAVAAGSLLAGCATERSTGSTSGETTTSPQPSAQPSAAADPARDAPAFPPTSARQSGRGSAGSDLVLTDVRAAEAEGYDRIVLEFSGTGTPGWVVNYVDEAVLEGSGEAVPLGRGAILDLQASGTTWPAPDYYSGPTRFTPPTGGEVDVVHVAGTFEGYTQVLAGIDGDAVPFRVFTLSAPSRLVVDVVAQEAD